MDKILNDQEKDKLSLFWQDEVMREAVKKVLLAALNDHGTFKPGEAADPTTNLAFGLISTKPDATNDVLGADLRAAWEGLRTVENAFSGIAVFAPDPVPPTEPTNPAI